MAFIKTLFTDRLNLPAPGRQALQIGLLFAGVFAAVYAATQSRDAPLIILFAAVYLIVINFGIPIPHGRATFAPVVMMTSLLILTFEPAAYALGIGLLLAEVTHPLWRPLWQTTPEFQLGWRRRLGVYAVSLLGFAAAEGAYRAAGGVHPLPFDPEAARLAQFGLGPTNFLGAPVVAPLAAVGALFVVTVVGQALIARWGGRGWAAFGREGVPALIFHVLLAQPFALFGAITYFILGWATFVVLCVGAVAFALALWVSWQNRAGLRRQMEQFASLNAVSRELRETLDPDAVLRRTYEQVAAVMPIGRFEMVLRREETSGGNRSTVERPVVVDAHGRWGTAEPSHQPNDFTRWVLEHGRMLNVDAGTMHYAGAHDLRPPQPSPSAWLGLPLQTDGGVLGVMVLQLYEPGRTFDRWSRELFVAIARQAGDAVRNAREHTRTVRLYDLTDRALAERAEQLQALMDSTRDGILMLDAAGRVVLVNPQAIRLLGDDRPQEGRPLSPGAVAQLGYGPDELQERLAALWAGETAGPDESVVVSGWPADGVRHVERAETAVRASGGDLLGWLIVLRDVTEERERAAWRTQFTHMVVHDLRNPVTALMSNAEAMARLLGDTARDRRLAGLVENGRRVGMHMLDMVDSLLDIARTEAGQLIVDAEAMRVPPIAARIVDYCEPIAAEKQIDLSFTWADDLPAVWADEELVRRILVNLLDNALKFTPTGGTVTGRLSAVDTVADGYTGGIRCEVIDSGPGIPAAARDRIFERFVRIGSGGAQVRGTGIGLSFCKIAVEAHDGRLWVEDGPSGGSRFVFTLPGMPVWDELDEGT